MIKVLHVVPNFGMGGAERMVVNLIRSSDPERFAIAAVSLYSRYTTDLEQQLDTARVPVWYLGKAPGVSMSMFPRLSGVVREFRPDIVHTHTYVLPYVLPVLLWRRRITCIHTVHNIAEREVTRVGRAVHRIAFRTGVVPVSIGNEVSESLERVYGYRGGPEIPNGIPVHHYQEQGRRDLSRSSLGIHPTDVVFVNVARFSPQKNHAGLIRAFAEAFKESNGTRLLLVGDGPLRGETEALVTALGLEQRISFLGPRTDIAEVLAAADVFVLSSHWEGAPLSLMEAMAAGKAVIATHVGCVPELVQEGVTGMLAPSASSEQFVRAMQDMAGDQGRRSKMGQAAGHHALTFDVSQMARRYEALYERLLAEARRA